MRRLRRTLIPMWQDIWPDIISRSERELTIQLGCGVSKMKHAVNVDMNPATCPDVLCDLDCTPYPFKDDSFDMVVALSVLEHLKDFLSVMGEIHRISKDGASIYILVPHFSSAAAFVDPTHRVHLSAKSCDYFVTGSEIEKNYGFYRSYRYKMVRRYIDLAGVFNYVPPLRWFVQRYPTFWENHLCFLIRGTGIFWELKVIKKVPQKQVG